MDKPTATYKQWLNLALDDLSWTKANLKEKIWYGACFTAQQAGEKALKAYLINQDKNVKKIHDLGALLEECVKIDGNFEDLKLECITLTDYYAPTRYPDIAQFINFTEEKAKEAYLLADKIVEFVKNKLTL